MKRTEEGKGRAAGKRDEEEGMRRRVGETSKVSN